MPKLSHEAMELRSEELIECTIACLVERGTIDVGLRDIQQSCRCSAGKMSIHFESKEELIFRVACVRVGALMEEFSRAALRRDLRIWLRSRLMSLLSGEGRNLARLDDQLASSKKHPEAVDVYEGLRNWYIEEMNDHGVDFDRACGRVSCLLGAMQVGITEFVPPSDLIDMFEDLFAPDGADNQFFDYIADIETSPA